MLLLHTQEKNTCSEEPFSYSFLQFRPSLLPSPRTQEARCVARFKTSPELAFRPRKLSSRPEIPRCSVRPSAKTAASFELTICCPAHTRSRSAPLDSHRRTRA